MRVRHGGNERTRKGRLRGDRPCLLSLQALLALALLVGCSIGDQSEGAPEAVNRCAKLPIACLAVTELAEGDSVEVVGVCGGWGSDPSGSFEFVVPDTLEGVPCSHVFSVYFETADALPPAAGGGNGMAFKMTLRAEGNRLVYVTGVPAQESDVLPLAWPTPLPTEHTTVQPSPQPSLLSVASCVQAEDAWFVLDRDGLGVLHGSLRIWGNEIVRDFPDERYALVDLALVLDIAVPDTTGLVEYRHELAVWLTEDTMLVTADGRERLFLSGAADQLMAELHALQNTNLDIEFHLAGPNLVADVVRQSAP